MRVKILWQIFKEHKESHCTGTQTEGKKSSPISIVAIGVLLFQQKSLCNFALSEIVLFMFWEPSGPS